MLRLLNFTGYLVIRRTVDIRDGYSRYPFEKGDK